MANRLAYEDSPYLQQHKDNPLDWYPWCDEAFEKAKHEHKPIFISIGYSSCHWCHVMEHEVFEDPEIAEFVNRHFVCIKVDREERPDIDKHYQGVHTLLNRRSGGWPLSIFCTPANQPFYAATYIPPHNRERMMGFSELTAIIAQKVAENDAQLFQNAEQIGTYLRPKNEPVEATRLNDKILLQFRMQAQHNFDPENGGFSTSPKFPHVSTLDTLMTLDALSDEPEVRKIVTTTLDRMARGGMYDLIDGGFCRYSTDERWLVPHFEKMTYDNALLCELYARAALRYDNPLYRTIAVEIAGFMSRLMMEDDLFYSASDADSEGEEGKYFVYTYDEVCEALSQCGVDDPETAAGIVGAVPEGNFEGHTIIRLSSDERPEWFATFRDALRRLRARRSYPFIDTKVITAWNAMMIKALFVLGRDSEEHREQGIRSLDRLLSTMVVDGVLQHSCLIRKAPKIDAFLEDYAYLCAALVEAYQCVHDERYLIDAQRFVNKALELFYDDGKWFFSRGAFTTEAELDDGTYPSAMGVMVDVLLSLGTLIDEKYHRFAFKSLEYVSLKLMKTPIYYPRLTTQVIRFLREPRVIKGTAARLAEITRPPHYPFVLFSNDETVEGFLVCGATSCYATTQNPSELDELVNATL